MNVTANELRDRRLWLEEEDDRGEGEKDWSYLGAVVKTVFTCVCCYMNSYMHLYYIYTYIYMMAGYVPFWFLRSSREGTEIVPKGC